MTSILHITGGLTLVGGTPRKLLYLAQASDRTLLRNHILCTATDEIAREFATAGVETTCTRGDPLHLTATALRLTRARTFDVIATHFNLALGCGALVARIKGLPWVHHEHGPYDAHRPAGTARAWAGEQIKKRALRHADGVIANSNYTARTVVSGVGVDENRIHVVHCPVVARSQGTRRVNEPNRTANNRPLVVGHVGGLIAARDQRTAILALAEVRRQIDAKLLIVGDGPLRNHLERYSVECGVADHVNFAGYRTDLGEFFNAIDLYVNPAVSEGFGIANVEAMLAGVPVLLANAGAHAELIRDRETGVLFEPGNAMQLAGAIVDLALHPVLRATIGDSGKDHAGLSFSPQKFSDNYFQAINAILNDSADIELKRMTRRAVSG
ncbi:MAG: glycosyltransferase family 4 protein [Steroidobacteraceae bacterium]